MNNSFYTAERNHQILISLLKAHKLKRVIISPGGTNIGMVASLQHDSFFELYSCIDERSAAYMACGIAAETKEPVAICCTGATASRNYYPALTEAYYRKLPVLAITCSHSNEEIGHHIPQVTDRANPPSDVVRMSVYLPSVHSKMEEWSCMAKANTALLELTHNGGGPVHINIMTEYSTDFSVKELPPVNVIRRIGIHDKLPTLNTERLAIYVGSHLKWDNNLTSAVEEFCRRYGAVVLCDQTSNYQGEYKVFPFLSTWQRKIKFECTYVDTLVHIGEITGAYSKIVPSKVWRVNPDGAVRDTFKKLKYVFEMDELDFFRLYNRLAEKGICGDETEAEYDAINDLLCLDEIQVDRECLSNEDTEEIVEVEKDQDESTVGSPYFRSWYAATQKVSDDLRASLDRIPFSNIWIAATLNPLLPDQSVLHLGILNSLRSWNMLPIDRKISAYSNVGGFGIDGGVSSLIGASFIHPETLYFGIVGDLAFFYDLNSLGNRHISNNVRILMINNGIGSEFKIGVGVSDRAGMGEATNAYVAAEGHYGSKSHKLVKDYAEDLGFEYLCADNKQEFAIAAEKFTNTTISDEPILLEAFINIEDEKRALDAACEMETSVSAGLKRIAREALARVLGEQGARKLKAQVKKTLK